METLISTAASLMSGAIIAVLASWLTNRSRNRADRQAEVAVLQAHADAMTGAIVELQATAATNRLLWDGTAERWRTFLLTALVFAGGAARARIAGGSDALSGLACFGWAVELLSRERHAVKQSAVAVRDPLVRVAAAAAPLMRSSSPAVVAAVEQLLAASADVDNAARLEDALESFSAAVRATTEPRASWWARRRNEAAGRLAAPRSTP